MTPEEVFLKLVHGIGNRELAGLAELYAEETDVRHPMNPYGDHPLLSRDALRQHFGGTGARATEVIRFQPENIRIHQTADPEVIVAEFDYVGTVLATGAPFSASNVIVLRVRDGQIVESRDYIHHLETARAAGRLDELLATIAQAPAA